MTTSLRIVLLSAALARPAEGAVPPASLAELAAPRELAPAELPEGFAEEVLVRGITGATGMALVPDGRILVCEQTGALRVVKGEVLLERPALELPVDSSWERGLLGAAVDPAFSSSGWIYLLWVARDPYPHHRLSRFTLEGDLALPGSERVLLEGDDQRKLGGSIPAGHQGGGVHFGTDGKLYLGLGEGTAGMPAQRLDTFQGKVLRLSPDGSIPPDNPFFSLAEGKYRAIWATGLRNPFGLAVDPATGRILVNDVGGSRWEEINEGRPGANHGWPDSEGPTLDPRHAPPLHAYAEGGAQSISAGTFYRPPGKQSGQFAEEYHGKYLFADYLHGWIRVLDPERPERAREFGRGLAGPVDLRVDAEGNLWCLSRNAWVKDEAFRPGTGALRRIFHVSRSGRPAPVITEAPRDAYAVPGQEVSFRVSATGAPPLRFQWERGFQWERDGKTVEGAGEALLVLPAGTPLRHGERWRCRISNAHGWVMSPAARLWLTRLREPDRLSPVVKGLEWESREVRRGEVVLFDGGSGGARGSSAGFDLAVRPRDHDFGLSFRGFLEVEREGAYTFHLRAAGRARLFISGAEVASTGPSFQGGAFPDARSSPEGQALEKRSSPEGQGGALEGRGAVGLRAGRHPLRLDHVQEAGAPHLEVLWSGPGLPLEPIPPRRLFRPDRAALAPPRIDPPGGSYSGRVEVELSTSTREAASSSTAREVHVRYTLDGSDPTPGSPLYRTPLLLEGTAVLRARAFRVPPGGGSPAAEASFRIEGLRPYGLQRRALVSTLEVPRRREHLPRLLSRTGVFLSLADMTAAPGLVPYEVNSPLWSDAALKRRWIALRGDDRLRFSATGSFRFPAGTVLVKHFELAAGAASPGRTPRLETRLLVVDGDGLGYGATYRWRPDGSDADLLDAPLEEEVGPPAAPGQPGKRWCYPGPADCLACHTAAAGFVLGVNARQLHRPFLYPGAAAPDDQLRTWSHLGLFEGRLEDSAIERLTALAALDDASRSHEDRARSYLDANCAHCHRPGGARAEFDARWDTPLEAQRLIAGSLHAGDLGLSGARVVAPGDRSRSMLLLRMARRQDAFNMPPLASRDPDREALEVVGRWIDGLARPR